MRKRIFALLLLVVSSSQKFTHTLKRCSVRDGDCLKEAVQDAIPKFKNGLKELGVSPLDPLLIPEMSVEGGEKIIQLKQTYKNVRLIGLANSKVTSVSIDLKDQRMLMCTNADQLVVAGDYAANGKILMVPVDGNGPFTIFLDQPIGTLLIDFTIYPKKGQYFLRPNRVNLIFDVSHASYNFTNLSSKNKTISLGKVLNENWKEIFDELSPFYTGAYAHAILKMITRFFSRIPLSEIFLDY